MYRLEKPDADGVGQTVPRGFVDARRAAEGLRITRIPPAPGLENVFDNHYLIEWDLADAQTEWHRVLPSPNANLIFGAETTALVGVVTGLRVDPVAGSGRVFGSRFRIGALRPYLPFAMSRLTDQSIPASIVTGSDDRQVSDDILREQNPTDMALALRDLMAASLRPVGPAGERAQAMMAFIRGPGRPTRVEQVANAFHVTQRSIERLYSEQVGVSPKWAIRRYRLQDVAFRLARTRLVSLSDLANEFGYFDQAHLTKEFTNLFGMSPTRFRDAQATRQPQ